jgi:hypothetical protein
MPSSVPTVEAFARIGRVRRPDLWSRFAALNGSEEAAIAQLRKPRSLKLSQGADFMALVRAYRGQPEGSVPAATERFRIEQELVAAAIEELRAGRWIMYHCVGASLEVRPVPAAIWATPGIKFHFDANMVLIGDLRRLLRARSSWRLSLPRPKRPTRRLSKAQGCRRWRSSSKVISPLPGRQHRERARGRIATPSTRSSQKDRPC